jgi:hypothetical protein
VHVDAVVLGFSAPAGRPDRISATYARTLHDGDRAEVEQRDGIPVRRRNGHRAAAARNRARESDHARGGCAHRISRRRPDVDAAMLTRRIGIASELKLPQHRSFDWPGPGEGGRNADQECRENREQDGELSHLSLLSVVSFVNTPSIATRPPVVKLAYSDAS